MIFPTTLCCRAGAHRGIYATARVWRADLSAAATTRGASPLDLHPYWTFSDPRPANDGCCRSGDIDAGGDACLSDRVCARPLGERRRAAGGDALVRGASCRDQADLGLFMPRNGRDLAVREFPNMLSVMPSTSRPSRWPTDAGSLFRKVGTARPKSRAFCTTCISPPATISPPCWRLAITPHTTTTSMSI